MSVKTASSTSKAIERWMKRVDLRGLRLRKVDADGQVVGRLASRLSLVLQGKDKPTYAPHLDNGDVVVVVNASNLDFTGNKWEDKLYRSHSGYPGGLKEVPAERIKARRGAGELLRRAVSRMLPKNKLRPVRMRKLLIYNGPESDFSDAYLWDLDLGSRKSRNLGHSWELPEGFQPMNPAAYWRHFRTSDPEWKQKMQEAFEKLGLDPDGDTSNKAATSKVDLIGERLQ